MPPTQLLNIQVCLDVVEISNIPPVDHDAMSLFTEFWTTRGIEDHTYIGRSRWVLYSQVGL